MINIVEALSDDNIFDQPCKYGNRVECHAVYCHNTEWKDAPRKCKRTWFTGGEVRDEDCEGFAAAADREAIDAAIQNKEQAT